MTVQRRRTTAEQMNDLSRAMGVLGQTIFAALEGVAHEVATFINDVWCGVKRWRHWP